MDKKMDKKLRNFIIQVVISMAGFILFIAIASPGLKIGMYILAAIVIGNLIGLAISWLSTKW